MSDSISPQVHAACESLLLALVNDGIPPNWTTPCHPPIFTLNAPLFLWLGCIVLVFLSVFFALRLFFKAAPLIMALNRVTKEINAIEPREKVLDGFGLEQLRDVMKRSSLVVDAWGEFEETLLFQNEGTNQQVFNTHQAENYFSQDAILGGRLNMRLYSALPGILTSVGLLLTFIAILVGLSNIHPDSTANGKLVGVEDLVYSLSGKFISSITALGLAVLFTFFEKRIESVTLRSLHNLLRALNKRFARKSTEHLLQLIQSDIREQSIAFRQFSTDLSGHLKESFAEGLGPHLQKVAEAVDELRKQKTESITDTLSQIVSEFKTTLMSSANSEFSSLGATLNQTTDLMRSMNEQSKITQEKMSAVIESLDAAVSKQSSYGNEHLTKLSSEMQLVIERLESVAAQSSGNMESSIKRILEHVQSNLTLQSTQMQRRNEELSALLTGMLEQIQASLSHSTTSVSSTVNGVIEKLESATSISSSNMESSISRILEYVQNNVAMQSAEMSRRNDELSAMLKGMLEQLQTSLNQSTIAVSSTVNGVIEKSSEWSEKTSAQLSVVLEDQTKNAKAINDARDALGNALEIFRGAIGESSSTLSIMNSSASSVREGMATLLSAVNNLGTTQDRVGDLASLIRSNAENLNLVVDRQGEIVTKYEMVVQDLDRCLSAILHQVTSSIENYSARVKSSLETTLGQFDNHLGNATAKLGGTVHDLGESLEDLVDLASRSRG